MTKLIYSFFALTMVAFLAFGFITNSKPTEGDKHPDVDWSLNCQECHSEETPEVFQKWESSKHGMVNFGCYICHGDGQENFYAVGIDRDCQGCHADKVDDSNLTQKSCFDCHDGHSLKYH